MSNYELGPEQHLAWIRENYSAVLDTPVEVLDTPLEDCPGWRIETVLDHFTRGAGAFRTFMTSSPDASPMADIVAALPAHARGAEAIDLARAEIEDLLIVTEGLDPDTPCPFVTGPATVATWFWHIAAETWIHRADVEHALDQSPGLVPDRGLDCLGWSGMFRQAAAGSLPELPAGLRCDATDADRSALVGREPVAAVMSGAASDLALRLWNRRHGPLHGDGPSVDAWADLKIISPLD